jgi:hypothetical protein
MKKGWGAKGKAAPSGRKKKAQVKKKMNKRQALEG